MIRNLRVEDEMSLPFTRRISPFTAFETDGESIWRRQHPCQHSRPNTASEKITRYKCVVINQQPPCSLEPACWINDKVGISMNYGGNKLRIFNGHYSEVDVRSMSHERLRYKSEMG